MLRVIEPVSARLTRRRCLESCSYNSGSWQQNAYFALMGREEVGSNGGSSSSEPASSGRAGPVVIPFLCR